MPTSMDGAVTLEYGGFTTRCLDWAQAVTEINTIADVSMNYIIWIDNLSDTCITDASQHSSLTMPGNNMAASLTVCPENEEETATLTFSGALTAYGNLTLKNICLDPTTDFSMAVYKSNAGASLQLENVTTTADCTDGATTGFISQILGTANATTVTLTDCGKLYVKSSILNVAELYLSGTNLTTGGTVTVTDVYLSGNDDAYWYALGTTTVTNIYNSGTGYTIGTKLNSTNTSSALPLFTVNGEVDAPIQWKVLEYASTATAISEVSDPTGIRLVRALKASAEMFAALNGDDVIAYKDTSGYVYNGTAADVAVRITKTTDSSDTGMVTYAKTYSEAVTIINNMADKTADYEILFLSGGAVSTTGKNTAGTVTYGSLTFPTSANSLTIRGADDTENMTQLGYIGTMTPTCNVTFENILLSEGTYSTANGFTPYYYVTPTLGGYAYELTFSETAQTFTNDSETDTEIRDAGLVFNYVNGSRGTLTVEDQNVYVKSYVSLLTLSLNGESSLKAASYITVTNLQADDSASLETYLAMTLTNLTSTGTSGNAKVNLITGFSVVYSATQRPTTQLTISGAIEGMDVEIFPYFYDYTSKSYRAMEESDAETMNIYSGKIPTNYDRLAVLTKASAENITVTGLPEEYTLYKYEGALYLTDQSPAVRLVGHTDSMEGETIYQADFLDWAQAVKEIDRIADSTIYYELLLLTDVGSTSSPTTTLTMPTRAKEVRIAPYTADGEAEESRYLFFTGTTISLGCNTTFENIGLMAVSGSYSGGVLQYASTTYNLTVGSWTLTQKEMKASYTAEDGTLYESKVGTVSGSSLGSYLYYLSETDGLAGIATNLSGFKTVELYTELSTGEGLTISGTISGVTKLILGEDVALSATGGNLTAVNLELHSGSTLTAKNVTSTGTLWMENASLEVGTDTVGDGICTLVNVECADQNSRIFVKQNASGTSQLTITGTTSYVGEESVSAEKSVLEIGIRYNNSASQFAQLYDGMTLLTAAKSASSFFAPYYTETDQSGMGEEADDYGLVKSGQTIKYAATDTAEVKLYYMETEDETSTVISHSLFATFEEAVTEINSQIRYQSGTTTYENYEIELLNDVEIGNTSGNGVYSALTLPSRAKNVRIYSQAEDGYNICFAGNLNLGCNLMLENVGIIPMKTVSGTGVPTSATWSLSVYTLTLDGVSACDEDGNTLVSAVTGSTNSELKLLGGTSLEVSGNYTAYQIRFDAEEGTEAALCVDGTLTTYLIYQDGAGDATIQKPLSSTFTLNGKATYVNGAYEYTSVIYGDEAGSSKVRVQLLEDDLSAGTKVLTCPYLDASDFVVLNASGIEYPTYVDGTTLLVGNLTSNLVLGGTFSPEVTYQLEKSVYDYTGSEICPGLVLMDENKITVENENGILTEGEDYTLTYSENIDAGTGTITVTAVDDSSYTGEGTITFTIRRKSLASSDIVVTFDGTLTEETVDGSVVQAPGVKVVDTGRTTTNEEGESESVVLTKDEDYTVSYRIESDGSVSAVVEGPTSGNYRGKVVKNFVEVNTADMVTLTDCIASNSVDGNTDAGGIARQETTQILITLTVEGTDLNGMTNLYLVEMDNQGNEILNYVGNASTEEDEDGNTALTAEYVWDATSDEEEAIIDNYNSTMMDRYAIVVVLDDGYQIISGNPLLIQNPSVTAVTTARYYSYYTSDSITSKKGMQGTSTYIADLGVQAETINILLNELILTSTNVRNHPDWGYIPYEYKGETYYFLDMEAYRDTIYSLNGWGRDNSYGLADRTNVTVDLLLGWDAELTYLIHPSARASGHTYYALNMQDEEARETFEALFSYLGYKLGGSDGAKYRVLNWVLGNEVNCCQAWNYSGGLSLSDCVENYAEAFQLLYQAIRRSDANARFFISLDHSWNVATEGHKGKDYLDKFAEYMSQTAPQMSWNVNYHPYSQPLSNTAFWNDTTNTTDSPDTNYISMQNLDVLTDYLGDLEEKYNMEETCKDTRTDEENGYIRVILGEQGYSAVYGNDSQEALQAEALSRLHDIAMANERVDAYTNRAYIDDPAEGLYLGLMNSAEKKKQSYDVFRDLWTDTE